MPANLDFALYFNIIFFSSMGFGFIFGYFRGLKKTLYSLIVLIIFYALFFLTIDLVINALWVLPIPFVFDYLVAMFPELSAASTIGDGVFIMLESYLGETIGDTLTNEMFISFISGLSQFVLKLLYTIIYFTVGRLLYKLLTFSIRIMFFSGKSKARGKKEKGGKRKGRKVKLTRKEKKAQKKIELKELKLDKKRRIREKKQLLGAVAGLAKGAVTAYVSLIVLGGFLNMAEGLLEVLPDANQGAVVYVEPVYLSTTYTQPLADPIPLPSELDAQLEEAKSLITAFNENIFVQTSTQLVLIDPNYEEPVVMYLYLFDSVFSFQFDEERINLRNEINTFSTAGAVALSSDFLDTQDLSDITSEEIIAVFNAISESNLVTSLIPLAIEVGSDMYDTPIEVPIDELYEIDWQTELSTLGAVVAVGFDLVNTAGILNDETDLETVTLDGGEVSDLFDSLGESELVTLAAYVALEPLLEEMGGEFSGIITVPADLDWGDEFSAFGEVAEAVLNTGITVADLQEADPSLLISALSEMDFTILLNSEIVSHALKNIFSGDAGIEGLDMIVVPDGIVWFDIYDEDGNLVTQGELRNILMAVNSITTVAGGFDFENLDFNIIADFDDETIDTIFNSELLVASISGFVLDMDLGDTPLVIPDSVLDENRYILKAELKTIASSARILVTELECDEGDTVCEETGFDVAKAFNISDESIDTLTSSKILAATIGQLIVDSGGEILTIPNRAMQVIYVDTIPQDSITNEEIKKLFQAVSVLEFTDLDNMTFDPSIIQTLGEVDNVTILDTEKSGKLFGSLILHATLSQMMFEQTEGESSMLSVPYFDAELNPIRIYNAVDEIDYVSTDELDDILQALLTLDITDFTEIDTLDLNLIFDNADELLGSAILHATISMQVFDLGGDIVTVPYQNEDGDAIRISVGDVLDSTDTEYIAKSEIIGVLDALKILGITDINSFDGTVDLSSITAEEGNIDIMLDSAILHATVSDQLFNLNTDGMLVVPYVHEDDLTVVRTTVGDIGFETEYIVKDEIKAMIDALEVLDIVDVESFDGTVDLGLLSEGDNQTIILSSATIQATISKQLIDLVTDGILEVPYVHEDNLTLVRKTVGEVGFQTEYILKTEITAMLDALSILEISDVESFDGSVDMGLLSEGDNQNIILASATIQATISKQLFDLATDGVLEVPYFHEDDLTPVRITVGETGFETEYILKTEITAMLDALSILEIGDVDTFDGTVNLGLLTEGDNQNVVLASATIQATISKQLIELATDDILEVPYFHEDDLTLVRVTVGNPGFETEYVLKVEITAMLDALSILDITDVESFDGSVDLGLLTEKANQTIVLASATIQATISKQLIDLDTDGTLEVPYYYEDGTTEVRKTVGPLGFETEYILKTEIIAMLDALDILDIGDVKTFDGTVDLGLLTEEANQTIVLASATIQATISKQLIELDDGGTLKVPYYQEDGVTAVRVTIGDIGYETEYVLKYEIKAMLDALDVLEISDVESFSGTVDLGLLTEEANQTIVLTSSTIQATISDQLIELDDGGTLEVPYYQEDGVTEVRVTVGGVGFETEYILKYEIKAMLDALDVLEISDVESFSGSVDLGLLGEEANQTIVLSSSTIQATISDQLIDLDLDGTLSVPYYEEDGVTALRVTVGDLGFETEYILKTEIKAMLDALDILQIGDVESFSGSVDLSLLTDGTNQDVVLASSTIQATVSQQLIDLDTDGTVALPYFKEDNTTAVRITVGDVGFQTEYVLKTEISAMLDAMDVLGITDVEAFTGTVEFAPLFEDNNIDVVLSSATIQATISQQLIDLDTDGTLQLPHFNEDGITAIRVETGPLGFETTYVTKVEITALIDALDALGITDVESFSGTVDLSLLMVDDNKTVVLSSSTIQATISEQLIDLDANDTVNLPYYKEDDVTEIRFTVGAGLTETEYVLRAELIAMIDAMDVLGINDIETFTGSVDLSVLGVGDNADTVLASAMIQATVSEQVIKLETDPGMAATFVVPYLAEDNLTNIRVTVGNALSSTDTEYIKASELSAMIDGLNILGITDVETFNGSIDLTDFFEETNRDILLSSAIMQATISFQLIDLGDSTLRIPVQDVDTTQVRITVGALLEETEYVSKVEIGAMFEALEVLGFDDINNFTGTIDLNNVYGTSNQNTILASASMHATITKQMKDLGPSVLYIPAYDIDGIDIEVSVLLTDFIIKDEIKAMINALEVLGITDITSFSGSFDLSVLSTGTAQDTLLSSAAIHATITETMLDLNDAVLIVPMYSQVGESAGNEIKVTVSGFEFVIKEEIKALINAFNAMGYGDLDSFGGSIDSSKFFDDRATLLLSSSIQATLSSKMIEDTGGELVVPDVNVNTLADIRLVHSDVTYIEINEMNAILHALELLGLTDFGSMSFSPANIFTVDFDELLASASIQATISENILPNADDETEPAGSSTIIIPTYFREDILVDSVSEKQIEIVELKNLLTALNTLGVSDFGGGMDSSVITSMDDTKLTTMLASGSIHTTIDNMMRGNSNINSEIPELAEIDLAYKTDLVTKEEIKAFIKATQTITTGSFTTVAFDLAAIASLTPSEQDTVASSMIVRNIITPELVTVCYADPGDIYTLNNTDFENDDPSTFLRKAVVLDIIDHYN